MTMRIRVFSFLCLLCCGVTWANLPPNLARLDYTALVSAWGNVLDGQAYQFDPLGLRTNIVRYYGLGSNSVSAGYDNIGQLISWKGQESTGLPRWN
jgi:hypothetical protein